MYSLTNAAKQAFKTCHKFAETTFYGTQETRVIPSRYIKNIEWERESTSGKAVAIGEFCASTLTLTLDNGDGFFDDLKFSGGEFYIRAGVIDDAGKTHYLSVGYYLVDEAPRKTKVITVDCYDRAVLFDKTADFSGLVFPCRLKLIADRAASVCGVSIVTDIEALPNGDYIVQNAPESGKATWRQVIMQVAEICASVAYINADGRLALKWYTQTGEALTAAERFSHDLYEDDNTISGVVIVGEDEAVYTAGTTALPLEINGNTLLQTDHQSVADGIFAAVGGFTYRPFEASVICLPYIEPLDAITYKELDGTEHPTVITHAVFVLNGKGELAGVGHSALEQGLEKIGGFTARQQAIINSVKNETNKEINEANSRTQAVAELNENIANSLGLYITTHEQADGSVKAYFHNGETLEVSTYICTMNGGGFAFTTGDGCWKGDDTIWKGGLTKDGNAVLNWLSVNKLTADQIDATNLKVNAANITGQLVIGQMPSTVAEKSDIPTKTSSLTNDSGYQTESGVTTIIDGRITTDYIEALQIKVAAAQITGKLTADQIDANALTATSILVKDTAGDILLDAGGNAVSIAGFVVAKDGFSAASGSYTTLIKAGSITISKGYDDDEYFYFGLDLSSNRISITTDSGGTSSGAVIEPSYQIIDYSRKTYGDSTSVQNKIGSGSVTVNATTFGNAVGHSAGTYTFMYSGGSWTLNNSTTVSLSTYGISASSATVSAFQVVYTTTEARYNFNKTEYGAVIQPPVANGELIIGSFAKQDPYNLVYNRLITRGAFLKFDDNLNALLCYDSRLGGKWYRYDVYTGTKTALW